MRRLASRGASLLGLAAAASAGALAVREVGASRGAIGAHTRRLVELASASGPLRRTVRAAPADTTGTTRVLWVSDVHNDPHAYALVGELVTRLGVQAVVDTGDSTALGAAVEQGLHAAIGDLPVPYVWVRGNQGSRATQTRLQALGNVRVLDRGATTVVAGLRFAGTGDPRFAPVRRALPQAVPAAAQLRRAGEELARAVAASAEPVDVALVHEPGMADPLFGLVPLVLDGHVHEHRSRRVDGTLELTRGSSGGAGRRGLDGATARPLEVSVLHFDPGTRRLVAVDQVTVAGAGAHQVRVERREASSYA